MAIDEKPFTAYYFSTAVAKPYLMPLRTASGIIISRNFPVVNSVTQADQKSPSFEPHQRPLYFDHGNIDGLNFWSEEAFGSYYHGHSRQAYGRMSLVNVEETKDGADAGTVRARLICFRRADASSAKRPRHFSFGVTNECA